METFDVYDESVQVNILRNGKRMWVPFWKLQKGDTAYYEGTYAKSYFICGEDAHVSDDPDYRGWLIHSEGGFGFFPEDFGAPPKTEVEDWVWAS